MKQLTNIQTDKENHVNHRALFQKSDSTSDYTILCSNSLAYPLPTDIQTDKANYVNHSALFQKSDCTSDYNMLCSNSLTYMLPTDIQTDRANYDVRCDVKSLIVQVTITYFAATH